MVVSAVHGDALMIAVGGVEDVAGNQLDGLDHAHSTDRHPRIIPAHRVPSLT
jgi:hypothetical protein